MPKITQLYAFVMTDKDSDDEGIMGMRSQVTEDWMPFVGADMSLIETIKPIADRICKQTGKTYKILRFKLIND